MNKKFSLGVCISLIAIASAITFVLTMTLSLNIYNEKVAGVGEREAIYTKLQDIDSYIRNHYIGSIDEERLVNGIMSGYMSGMGDNKSRYITADEYHALGQQIKGRIVTAGLLTERDESGYIRILEVYEGSSARLQGILAGDIITHVDGLLVLEIGADEALKRLEGSTGTRVPIRTQRAGESQNYTLIRQDIELISVKYVIHDDIGFIKISGFSDRTGDQFETALDSIIENNAKGLIIDLRGASGSVIMPLKQIMDRLIPRTIAAVGEYRTGILNNIIETTHDSYFDLPIIVITDSSTSEGGELLAAVLRDFGSAQLVGANTKGDPIFTTTQALRDGSAVILSYMKVRSAGGTSFDSESIKPDFSVEATASPDTDLENIGYTADAQIKKAFEVIETKIERPLINDQQQH